MADFNISSKSAKTPPACPVCGKPIKRTHNAIRHTQVRGARINQIEMSGTCGSGCRERDWSTLGTGELIEPQYQIEVVEPDHPRAERRRGRDESGNEIVWFAAIVLDDDGKPIPGVEPSDPVVEMKIDDFFSHQPATLVQIHPVLVFESKEHVNDWWLTPETKEEQDERLAAKAGEVDHRNFERIMYEGGRLQAIEVVK